MRDLQKNEAKLRLNAKDRIKWGNEFRNECAESWGKPSEQALPSRD